ncbi:translational activator of cytochrome c oxidase 1-like isoform X2 [Dermochelys coriacea]|uniref:translational activator of cytochrome c oxidase 1-like isoform X2 n=1 Tax=Dermochelys coriacea TaxID=27794 RepID=UPI0018E785A2|nr:translational activator of cytochrome c oxidase 1-like isoform X2 [Dermochelys coriacea]
MPCSGLGVGIAAAAPASRSLGWALHTSDATPAGHNKWSKVKHIKGLRDTERSRLFQKLATLLRFARKAGGPNPDFNTNLANITEQCRGMVLTKASTEVVIKGRDAGSCTWYQHLSLWKQLVMLVPSSFQCGARKEDRDR